MKILHLKKLIYSNAKNLHMLIQSHLIVFTCKMFYYLIYLFYGSSKFYVFRKDPEVQSINFFLKLLKVTTLRLSQIKVPWEIVSVCMVQFHENFLFTCQKFKLMPASFYILFFLYLTMIITKNWYCIYIMKFSCTVFVSCSTK